ncbi:MAG: hypothetical protein OEY51_09385, partial [Cyclobacteriaceae bacterium]|nr:hypothetical protein [Cyclobacteriaceae bacterium]
KFGEQNAAPFLTMVEAFKIMEIHERESKPFEAEVIAFALGNDFAVVGLPGEIFTELGMYIRERSPFKYTIVASLTNGDIGYVPDRKAYLEGNYEPISSRVAPGSGEVLVERALKMLHELKE